MRRRASAYEAVTDVIALPSSRAAASARARSSTLRRFSIVSGSTIDASGATSVLALQRDAPFVPPPPLRRGARRGLGRTGEPGLGQVGGVREAGGVAAHDAQPGATIASRDELLDAPVVETAARRPPIFDEHLSEVAAGAQRMVERGLKKLVIDHLTYRKPMSLTPGLTASITLVVDETDTAVAIGSGDVPVLATPRIVTLAEQASVAAIERQARSREDVGRLRGAARAPLAHPRRRQGHGRSNARGRSRAGGSRSASR